MLAVVVSSSLLGVAGYQVRVEVHISNGLPSFQVVGQPDGACREARDRVRAALLSSGFSWPQRRITVNLAPPGIRKAGAGLDVPIALGVLAASEQCPSTCLAPDGRSWGFLGELGLDGSLRSVPGVLALVDAMRADAVVVAPDDAAEAGLAVDDVRCARDLATLVAALNGRAEWTDPPEPSAGRSDGRPPDLADVAGQPFARLALEVAAAGRHHLLLVGPPGAGKTMLATRLPSLLPQLDRDGALEVTRIHSAAGLRPSGGALMSWAPFRAPHHTASLVGMVGGGTSGIRPGELSLAHRGVLFLDELGEFPPRVLDALRQPLSERRIRVTRAHASVDLPADFLLVAATNPCPCGFAPSMECVCSPSALNRYARRLSGPLLDRFDLRVTVGRPRSCELLRAEAGEPSATARRRVAEARRLAAHRESSQRGGSPRAGAVLAEELDHQGRAVVREAVDAGRLSARGADSVIRVARTLADLDGRDGPLAADHVALAMQLRADVTMGSRNPLSVGGGSAGGRVGPLSERSSAPADDRVTL